MSPGALLISLRAFARHDNEYTAWTAIKEINEDQWSVYDITKWISKHPGGAKILLVYAGRDASKVYNDKHGDDRINTQPLVRFVGYLDPATITREFELTGRVPLPTKSKRTKPIPPQSVIREPPTKASSKKRKQDDATVEEVLAKRATTRSRAETPSIPKTRARRLSTTSLRLTDSKPVADLSISPRGVIRHGQKLSRRQRRPTVPKVDPVPNVDLWEHIPRSQPTSTLPPIPPGHTLASWTKEIIARRAKAAKETEADRGSETYDTSDSEADTKAQEKPPTAPTPGTNARTRGQRPAVTKAEIAHGIPLMFRKERDDFFSTLAADEQDDESSKIPLLNREGKDKFFSSFAEDEHHQVQGPDFDFLDMESMDGFFQGTPDEWVGDQAPFLPSHDKKGGDDFFTGSMNYLQDPELPIMTDEGHSSFYPPPPYIPETTQKDMNHIRNAWDFSSGHGPSNINIIHHESVAPPALPSNTYNSCATGIIRTVCGTTISHKPKNRTPRSKSTSKRSTRSKSNLYTHTELPSPDGKTTASHYVTNNISDLPESIQVRFRNLGKSNVKFTSDPADLPPAVQEQVKNMITSTAFTFTAPSMDKMGTLMSDIGNMMSGMSHAGLGGDGSNVLFSGPNGPIEPPKTPFWAAASTAGMGDILTKQPDFDVPGSHAEIVRDLEEGCKRADERVAEADRRAKIMREQGDVMKKSTVKMGIDGERMERELQELLRGVIGTGGSPPAKGKGVKRGATPPGKRTRGADVRARVMREDGEMIMREVEKMAGEGKRMGGEIRELLKGMGGRLGGDSAENGSSRRSARNRK